ncbi:MAG: sigma 54-interacting transcriptional regulator [Desulfobacterales bacterium]
MKKGEKKDYDYVRAMKSFRAKENTAEERNKPPKFVHFKALMEKYFLEKNETNFTGELKDRFSKELGKLGLSNEDIFLNLVHFFAEIFWTATMKITNRPLHTSRDFALEIYGKAFSNLFDKLNQPAKSAKLPVGKVDLIMFLTGIIDSPFECQAITDIVSSISYRLKSFAESNETVLITGETGTGKELHAKAIHYLSPRSKEKFVAINCAGIPETLLESELFGHERGSFTGADKIKNGLLKEVGKGTLFLDEIGDMPIALQAKVLRVLQSGDYRMIGGNETLYFEGRVIAATNMDLRTMMREKPPKFRPDLFYRLNVLPIKLHSFRTLSLHERRKAILYKLKNIIHSKKDKPGDWNEMNHLTGSGGFVAEIVSDGAIIEIEHSLFSEAKNPYISEEAMRLILRHNFLGNYRELDNLIRCVYVLAGGKRIEADLLRNEGIGIETDKQKEVTIEETGKKSIMLKDIIEHANKVKTDIVQRRINAVYLSGQNLKRALAAEGMYSNTDYMNFRNKIETIIGKGEISRIIKECKLSKVINK